MKQIDLPLIVVARSGLGTLNHSLLTLKVLKSAGLEVKGLILSGPLNPLNKKDLEKWGDVPILLEIPQLSKVTKPELLKLFQNFSSHL